MDLGGGVLLDTVVVSRGILGVEGVDSGSSEEGCESISPVTTGRDEGVMTVGENEGRLGSATDGRGFAVSTRREGGMVSCLFAQDLQDRRTNSMELLPVLAGRLDGSPERGRLMIIVPEKSPSCAKE